MHNSSGDVVLPKGITVYYKTSPSEPNAIELPAGLRMIAGFDFASPNTASNYYFRCVTDGGAHTKRVPDCAPGGELHAAVTFPSCWDGQRLDAADHRSHMAYPNPTCPASHPYKIPRFELVMRYVSDGSTENWYLSSDRDFRGQLYEDGQTLHADWFGAWDPEILATWTDHCINRQLNCSGGALGNGTMLVSSPVGYTGGTIPTPPAPFDEQGAGAMVALIPAALSLLALGVTPLRRRRKPSAEAADASTTSE